jgi:hypothetical protein
MDDWSEYWDRGFITYGHRGRRLLFPLAPPFRLARNRITCSSQGTLASAAASFRAASALQRSTGEGSTVGVGVSVIGEVMGTIRLG